MNADTPTLPTELLQELHVTSVASHLGRLALFVAIHLGAAWAAVTMAEGISGGWKWLVIVPCHLLAAAALHGISLFTHEAVHGTLMSNRVGNALLGAICAWPVLQNYSAYRVLHLRHHQHLGEDGDPDHYANYTRWTWLIFIMNWLRLIIGYPVYITAITVHPFLYRLCRRIHEEQHPTQSLGPASVGGMRQGKEFLIRRLRRLRRLFGNQTGPTLRPHSTCFHLCHLRHLRLSRLRFSG